MADTQDRADGPATSKEEYGLEERREITEDLESGAVVLVLEQTNGKNAKCRAPTCLVECLGRGASDGNLVQGAWRIRLEPTTQVHWTMSGPRERRRYYHVSCFEVIGVDMPKHLRLGHTRYGGQDGLFPCLTIEHVPPAYLDWGDHGGRCFPASRYKEWVEAMDMWHKRRFLFGASRVSDTMPSRADFIADDPTERVSLVELLLDDAGAGPLLSAGLSLRQKIMYLDLWNSEERLAAALVRFESEETVPGREKQGEKAGDSGGDAAVEDAAAKHSRGEGGASSSPRQGDMAVVEMA